MIPKLRKAILYLSNFMRIKCDNYLGFFYYTHDFASGRNHDPILALGIKL